jgi:branched-subunit amino acid ABC-type transport system permease component
VETLAASLFSEDVLRFVLLGMATGSLTALVALGIVLVYRTSGVLNFGAGALGGSAPSTSTTSATTATPPAC